MCARRANSEKWGVGLGGMWQHSLHNRTREDSVKASARPLTGLQTKRSIFSKGFRPVFFFFKSLFWIFEIVGMHQIWFSKCWDWTWEAEWECHSVQLAKVFEDTHSRERENELCSSISISQDTLGVLWYTFGPSSLSPFSWPGSSQMAVLSCWGNGPPRSNYRWISSPRSDLRCTGEGTSVQPSFFFFLFLSTDV